MTQDIAYLIDKMRRQSSAIFIAVEDIVAKDISASLKQAALLLEESTRDQARLDWLSEQYVEVRKPLVYGSHHLFHAGPERGDGDEEPSKLREQIDEAQRK